MNLSLSSQDWLAISPMICLVGWALGLLLIEIFAGEGVKRGLASLACIGLLVTAYFVYVSPSSDNRLLTQWLRFDSLVKVFNYLFLFIGFSVICLARGYFKQAKVSLGEFYFLLLSALFGLFLISAAVDFLTLFLGLETLSIALYICCGYLKISKLGQEAAIKYFLMGAIATALLLFGIALVYGATGTTKLEGLQAALSSASQTDLYLLWTGIGFVSVGLLFKAAVAPFHMWAADVYEGSPLPVTAFMSCATKVAAFAAIFNVFLQNGSFHDHWQSALTICVYITLIYANLVALRQTKLKRFFAYSGISHAGFLLIPIAAGAADIIPSLLYYMVIYTLATLGAFAVLLQVKESDESLSSKDVQGLFYRSPLLALALALCLLTLAAIPPAPGFFAKFYLFKAAASLGRYDLIVLGIATSLLSAIYYLNWVSLLLKKPHESFYEKSSLWAQVVVLLTGCAQVIATVCPRAVLSLLNF